eukprot:NODE_2116_length_2289_cov_9.520814.p1 GENE.NODE_2116_length_2289_cov_9.520814~~NODE_2116_length_2289_cov_9.520814.p1  ORF type:complete len:554 (+),score=176.92 NODE_2116_length_2289_cov_9.520814:44-1663(+)
MALGSTLRVAASESEDLLSRGELATAIQSLSDGWSTERIEHILTSWGAAEHVRSEDFLEWLYGDGDSTDAEVASLRIMLLRRLPANLDGALAAPPGAAETDGEETGMDVPSLVRLRCFAEYGGTSVGDAPLLEEEVGAGSPPPPPPLTLSRARSTCSGAVREVPESEVKASVVLIQRAVRSAGVTGGGGGGVAAAGAASAPVAVAPPGSASGAPLGRRRLSMQAKARPETPAPEAPLLRRAGGDCIFSLRGAILLTAPHSLKLVRGPDGRSRNHKRERWTAELAVVLAREMYRAAMPASLMIWNRAAVPARGRLDPNYLEAHEFPASPWHRGLHRWMLTAGGNDGAVPLLHVDLHGKVSEKLHLDLGIAPLEEVWTPQEQPVVAALKAHLALSLDEALRRRDVRSEKGRLIQVDGDPRLNGYWGSDTVTTISHQSVLLGVPAVQFEMPLRLRERLVHDGELCSLFAAGLIRAYREVISPWWAQHRTGTPCVRRGLNAAIAADAPECGPPAADGFEGWSTQLLDELVALERASAGIEKQI